MSYDFNDPNYHNKELQRQLDEMEENRLFIEDEARRELNGVINDYLNSLRACFKAKKFLINYLKKDTELEKNRFLYHGPEVFFNDWALMFNEDSLKNKNSLIIDRLVFQKESFKSPEHLEVILDKYVNEHGFFKKPGNQLEKEVDIDGSKNNVLLMYSNLNKLCIKMFIPIKTPNLAQYLL